MLEMRLQGTVSQYPDLKTSARGVQYCRVTVEVPSGKAGTYAKRVNLTGFGDTAVALNDALSPGDQVEIIAEPQAKAYMSKKTNEPAASLEGIVRTYKVLSAKAKAPVAKAPEPAFDESDIPF